MNPKNIIVGFFTNWTRPILFFAFSLVLLIGVYFFSDNITVKNTAFYFCCFALLPLIFSIIYQLVKRQFGKSALSFGALIIGLAVIVVIAIMAFLKQQSLPDHYADKLVIPTNIKINIPSDTTFSPSEAVPDFQLYKGNQPGLYGYAVWLKNMKKGYCYLKAFEVTQNDPLSARELKTDSRIDVFNPADSNVRFGMGLNKYGGDKVFTIYEGDWHKPYAARFELWFVPANGSPERKIAEKNFKVEGWMR